MTMGCLARLGCLILLVALCVGAWFTRNLWIPARFRPPPPIVNTWQPVTDAGAARTRDAFARLSRPRGPLYETLSAGDVASLAFSEASRKVGGSVDSVSAKIDGDRASIRALVSTTTMRSKLGPVAGVLRDREWVQLTGTFYMLRPGVGEFEVERAMLGQVILPTGMIPRLVREIDNRPRPAGLADNALLLPVPTYVSDIRIANGKVTVYKNVK
jgi:hypothetical protein